MLPLTMAEQEPMDRSSGLPETKVSGEGKSPAVSVDVMNAVLFTVSSPLQLLVHAHMYV